ncbi:MAG: helix-turn-helix transcriptional regulator [Lentimonas sp.]
MSQSTKWNLLSNHANVLITLAREPKQPLRQVAYTIRITERAVQRIVAELEEVGYLSRERNGRQNVYKIHKDASMSHVFVTDCTLGQFLELFHPQSEAETSEDERLLGSWTIGEHGSEIKS